MTIKEFVEKMTDQRIKFEPFAAFHMLQHTLYAKVLKPESIGVIKGNSFQRPAKIVITNTPF